MTIQTAFPGATSAFNRLVPFDEAVTLIGSGRYYSIAAEESLLRRLPKGNWIAGTIPYFMGQDGGETTRDKLFLSQIPVLAGTPSIRFYDLKSLPEICVQAPANGFSMIILPAFSEIHSSFARNGPGYKDMYLTPLVGWVSGIHLDDSGKAVPMVVNGQTGELSGDRAIVIHVPLPANMVAHIDIVNLFKQGDGDVLQFSEGGFSAGKCLVNGKPAILADYLLSNNIDTRLPLVADYCGAMINVCIKGIDKERHTVDFYAPVFEDTVYRIAAPIDDYVRHFQAAISDKALSVVFCCNCILNYLYSELEGKRTTMLGPMTFGEVAYQLLNQTLVYMTIETAG